MSKNTTTKPRTAGLNAKSQFKNMYSKLMEEDKRNPAAKFHNRAHGSDTSY